ncbi:MAG: hypothetical protein QXG99_08175 [Conexivisphaerales archaeon]
MAKEVLLRSYRRAQAPEEVEENFKAFIEPRRYLGRGQSHRKDACKVNGKGTKSIGRSMSWARLWCVQEKSPEAACGVTLTLGMKEGFPELNPQIKVKKLTGVYNSG